MATYLDAIIRHHRERVAADDRPLSQLIADAADQPRTRGFRSALCAGDTIAVISEIKRRSPSKGLLNDGLDPAQVAAAYESGGAAALSVLTDEPHFGGSTDDLQRARAAVTIPVLRKDFTLGPNDVCDARIMGADAVLLIVAALDDDELHEFFALAMSIGLDVLVETHDESEIERALGATDADLIGVNQRDLVTFSVDTERAVRVVDAIPEGAVRVAESGVSSRAQAETLAAAGYDAVLVGEHVVTSGDPRRAVAELAVPRGRTTTFPTQ